MPNVFHADRTPSACLIGLRVYRFPGKMALLLNFVVHQLRVSERSLYSGLQDERCLYEQVSPVLPSMLRHGLILSSVKSSSYLKLSLPAL